MVDRIPALDLGVRARADVAEVAALALVPLLLNGQAPGKEILHPVAIVIFGGLISSTLLDTLLTPVIFWKLGEKKIISALED